MDKAVAGRIVDVTEEASRLLNESVARVRDSAPERAANVYRSSVGQALGGMAAGILFRVWREYPELEPAYMREPSGYNPRQFQMPPAVAEDALGALKKAMDLMKEVERLLEHEPDAAERAAYSAEIAGVLRALVNATRGVERRTEPSRI